MLKIDSRFTDTTDTTPIVAVDIDGVLNFCGYLKPLGVRFKAHTIDHFRVFVRTDILRVLEPLLEAQRQGRLTLAWGTMWEENAPRHFAPKALSGVGADWPVIYFNTLIANATLEERKAFQDEKARHRFATYCFKSPAIADFSRAVNRQVIWLDDMVNGFDRSYLAMRADEDRSLYAALAVTVPEETGLTEEITNYVVDVLIREYEESGLLI